MSRLVSLEPLKLPDVAVQICGTCPRITQRRAACGCVWFGQKQSRGMSTQGKLGGGIATMGITEGREHDNLMDKHEQALLSSQE